MSSHHRRPPHPALGLALVALLLSLFGCTSVKEYATLQAAVSDLSCPVDALTSRQIAVDTYHVTGCERSMVYTLAPGGCHTLADCNIASSRSPQEEKGKKGSTDMFVDDVARKVVRADWSRRVGCALNEVEVQRTAWQKDIYPETGFNRGDVFEKYMLIASGCDRYGVFGLSGACNSPSNCYAHLSKRGVEHESTLNADKAALVRRHAADNLECRSGRVEPELPSVTAMSSAPEGERPQWLHERGPQKAGTAQTEAKEASGRGARAHKEAELQVVNHFLFEGCGLVAHYQVKGVCFSDTPCVAVLNPIHQDNFAALNKLHMVAVKRFAWDKFSSENFECRTDAIVLTEVVPGRYLAEGCDYRAQLSLIGECNDAYLCNVSQIGKIEYNGPLRENQERAVRARAGFDLSCNDKLNVNPVGVDSYSVAGCDMIVQYNVTGTCHSDKDCFANLVNAEKWERIGIDQQVLSDAVKSRAAFDFKCPNPQSLRVTPLLHRSYMVQGCQQRGIYRLEGRCSNLSDCRIERSLDEFTSGGGVQAVMLQTVQRQAAFDLNCEVGGLRIAPLGGSSFGVVGCGQRASYITFGRCQSLDDCTAAAQK